MSFFIPDLILNTVLDVTPELLASLGVKAAILDVDNTLTTHGNPEPALGVQEWIDEMQTAGIPLMIVSNNVMERVRPFAQRLGLPFVSMGCKPLTFGFTKACKRFGRKPKEVAIIGDQIFTDVLGGSLKGMKTILVNPLDVDTGLVFRIKRRLERRFVRKYHRLKGDYS